MSIKHSIKAKHNKTNKQLNHEAKAAFIQQAMREQAAAKRKP